MQHMAYLSSLNWDFVLCLTSKTFYIISIGCDVASCKRGLEADRLACGQVQATSSNMIVAEGSWKFTDEREV